MKIDLKSGIQYRARLIMLFALAICGCDRHEQLVEAHAADAGTPVGAFVQLFEWRWVDIAAECETFLGPAGYEAVQVSPPNEHITGPAWWTRYQPVSYKIESRGGTRAEFADMVARCKDVGVDIYADAIINHMAGFAGGSGVAGSTYSEFSYPVPYEFDDFHHCGRYDDDRIRNYQDLWEIQNCQLGTLDDLDTGKPSVQNKIAAYLNDLLSLGVAGFRLDAVKHIAHDEVAEILQLVDGDPFVFQEVIDRGGEPIDAMNYVRIGKVTEFKYPPMIVQAFEYGNLDALTDFWSQPGWLPTDDAIVFVDNHDIQRGHAASGDIVNYKDGPRYDLAVAFMLAHPYGYPLVMSSYQFEDDGQGPPASSPHDDTSGCGYEWVCEHRRNAIAKMVGFRKAVGDAKVVHWQIIDDTTLSFGRGDKGHIVINTGEQTVHLELQSDMPAGKYNDLISGSIVVNVDDDGLIHVSLAPMSAIAIKPGG
jgi:alpha-amylase